jgi:flagellar assembly protein FliH
VAKNVFKPTEIVNLGKKVQIDPPPSAVPEAEEPVTPAEEYTGPTADDLRREAEEFKQNWEQEKETMISAAKSEADRIVKEAESVAFEQVKEKNNEAQKVRQEAEDEARRIVSEAKSQAEESVREAESRVAEIEAEARKKGSQEGREAGFAEGRAEVERLVERVHVVLNRSIEKRNEIIAESETQVINLVLLIARKVIKVISENQKNVVVNNTIQALRKLKSRGDVVIRVNLADVQLATEHVKDFVEMVEQVESVTVLEDSSVDRGGCIIETDFGQVDARISSQLHEIEEKILELMPIRAKGES